MKKTIALGAIGLAAFATFGLGTAAQADETVAPATTIVSWAVPGGFDSRFSPAQTLFTGVEGDCGQPDLQVDTYKYDTPEHIKIVDDLVTGGTLTGSDKDSAVWVSNRDVPATPACETEPTPPPATETPTPPITTTPEPTPTDTPAPVETTPAASPTPKPSEPAPEATPSATATATVAAIPLSADSGSGDAGSLAYTGTEHLPLKLSVAGALLAAGIGARVLRRRWSAANAVVDNAPID